MRIILSLPPTTNHIWGYSRRGVYLTSKAKTWKEQSQFQMRVLRSKMLTGKVAVSAVFFLKYDRDVDNIKLLLDSMSNFIYKDDSQIVELHIFKIKDKTNPRVEVEVTEV